MGTEFKSYSDLLRLYHALSAKCSQLYGRCRQNGVNCMDAVGRMQSIIWTLSTSATDSQENRTVPGSCVILRNSGSAEFILELQSSLYSDSV